MVGEVLKVTLTTDETIQGTVMSLNKEQQVLVLLLNPSEKYNDVRMIRLPFIKNAEIIGNPEKEALLPDHIGANEALPAMAESNMTYNRTYTHKLKGADSKRSATHKDILEGELSIPVGAYETFEKISKIYHDAVSWQDDATAISINKEIVVVGEPDWSTPVVKNICSNDETVVNRIRKLVEKN